MSTLICTVQHGGGGRLLGMAKWGQGEQRMMKLFERKPKWWRHDQVCIPGRLPKVAFLEMGQDINNLIFDCWNVLDMKLKFKIHAHGKRGSYKHPHGFAIGILLSHYMHHG